MITIVIDPGHGGSQEVGGSSPNNAQGPRGTLEKTLALDIGKKLQQVLTSQSHAVIMTRNSDVNLGLVQRATMAKNNQAPVFVSIHFNGNSNPSVQGTETWVHKNAGDKSKLLASALLSRLVQVTGYRNRGVFAKSLGVVNPANHHPNTAASLIEISFMSDPADEQRLGGEDYRMQLAQGIAVAIDDYLNGRAVMVNVQKVNEIAEEEDVDI